MTREEAMNWYAAKIAVNERFGLHGPQDEAARLALAALRDQQAPVRLDRERWEGCEYCLEDKDLMTLVLDIPDEMEILNDRVGFRWNEEPRYCPICGRPLTEEAWAELERKIGGNDGKTDI